MTLRCAYCATAACCADNQILSLLCVMLLQVWVDNLLLRMVRESDSLQATVADDASLLYWEQAEGDSDSRLYMTNVTLQCDGDAKCRSMFAKNGVLYAGGAVFSCTRDAPRVSSNAVCSTRLHVCSATS